MLTATNTVRLVVALSALLTVTIAATGFATTRYRREKQILGRHHYEHGQALEHRADLNEAIEEYRKALIFCPDTPDYRMSFASALLEAGRLDEAETHIDQLLQEDPTNGELNLLRARVAVRRRTPAKAIEYYQRAVYEYWPPQRVEERREARLELVNLLSQTGRRAELIGELMTMYANAPNDPVLRARIGLNLLDHGASSEAMQVFRELLRTQPKNADAHRGLAQSYFASGEYISARHEFERAMRLNPHDTRLVSDLKLTNAVVELDPDLAGIQESERMRRAQNLLRGVLADIQTCGEAALPPAEAEQAQKLLSAPPARDSDLTGELRRMAEDLWQRRARFCSGKPTDDTALATVLARLATETVP